MSSDIPVYYETIPVGWIEVDADGPTFLYDPGWIARRNAFPLSVLMPVRKGRFPATILQPWLMNLLPEGNALPTVGRNLGVSPQDVVGLVARMGRDTAGALSIGRPRAASGPSYIPMQDERSLERVIAELPARPFLAGRHGVSMSLAGAQEKLPVALIDGDLAIPVNGTPSTHILKPDISRLSGSVHNEALCMVLAARVGQRVAEVTTGKVGGRSYLLITRYDRVQRDGRWRRLHQEDFCQALGKPPGAKYEHNNTGIRGPGLADFFGLVRRHLQPGDVLRLRDAVILNVLLSNVDAHAKNYSLLLTGQGATMAPLYDLMCGAAWPDVTQNMAQDIGGKNRGKFIAARHWRREAAACGLNGTALLRRVAEMASAVAAEVDAAAMQVRAMPAGGHPMLPEFVDAIKARCRTVVANLAESAPGQGPADEGDSSRDEEMEDEELDDPDLGMALS
jgi:serine/threonine-protein kinase HipA